MLSQIMCGSLTFAWAPIVRAVSAVSMRIFFIFFVLSWFSARKVTTFLLILTSKF